MAPIEFPPEFSECSRLLNETNAEYIVGGWALAAALLASPTPPHELRPR